MDNDWFPNHIFRKCDKCRKIKVTRYYHGGNEDTFDFYLCRSCELKYFNDYLRIPLEKGLEEWRVGT